MEHTPIHFLGVMVSSTFTDLEEHRAALIKAIDRQSLKSVAMENDSAKPDGDVIDSSLEMVRKCSAYIGVISHKYGQIPDCPVRNPERRSLTELEFREARNLNRPILIFIMGDDHPVKHRDVESDETKRSNLLTFREEAKLLREGSHLHRVYKIFDSLMEFEVAATQSIAELRRFLDSLYPPRPTEQAKVSPKDQPTIASEQSPYSQDRRPVNYRGATDLDEHQIEILLASRLARDITSHLLPKSETQQHTYLYRLEQLGCLTEGKPTIGAFLCMGRNDRFGAEVPSCTLQMANYNSPHRGGDDVALKLGSGNLLSLYEQGMEWLTGGAVLQRVRAIVGTKGEDTEIPSAILREALVNALVHRDYSRLDNREQPTRIDVYSDRVEITSFGGVPNGVAVEKLNSPDSTLRPYRRNPVIAQIFQCMGLAELNASGVERMSKKATESRLRKPLFLADHDAVCIRLFRPTTKFAVFISSVQREFAAERKEVAQLLRSDPLLSRHFEPFLFEELPASSESVEATMLGAVDRCDLFLGIFGTRYGATQDEGLSFTELEYSRASDMSKPRLVFIEGGPERKRDKKMDDLIRRARSEVVSTRFSTLEEFIHQVRSSLVSYLAQNGSVDYGALGTERTERTETPGASLADISTRLAEFAKSSVRIDHMKGNEPDELMKNLGLMTNRGLTMAGVLLFGSSPQRFFPQARVRCTAYPGLDISSDVIDDRDVMGNIFEQVENALAFISTHLARRTSIEEAKLTRVSELEIPVFALREVVLNALAHRDYRSSGSIQISIFSDRIEVWNPGALPSELKISELRDNQISLPNNPDIANALYLGGLVERMGRGIPLIFDSLKKAWMPEPEFVQRGQQFGVRLRRVEKEKQRGRQVVPPNGL